MDRDHVVYLLSMLSGMPFRLGVNARSFLFPSCSSDIRVCSVILDSSVRYHVLGQRGSFLLDPCHSGVK